MWPRSSSAGAVVVTPRWNMICVRQFGLAPQNRFGRGLIA